MNDTLFELPIPTASPLFGDWAGIACAEGSRFVEIPTGANCLSCGTPILEDEAGVMVLVVNQRASAILHAALAGHAEVLDFGDPDAPRAPVHRGCMLLDYVGCEHRLCSHWGYDGLGSQRRAAQELERRILMAGAIAAIGELGATPHGLGDA